MKLRFGTDFDTGAWPDALAGRQAAVGEDVVGPMGMLGALESALGLGGEFVSEPERVAALVPRIAKARGFWEDSAKLDPLGSARELLRWRDLLLLSGWSGEATGMPERVAALAGVTQELPMGTPDRIRAVAERLRTRGADFDSVECADPIASFPLVWRQILKRLATHGTQVDERIAKPVDPAVAVDPAAGVDPARAGDAALDLAAARGAGFEPRRDGSLLLLRPDGPWAAAEETAAWLAALVDLDDTVIVSPSALLDSSLRRFGLPTTGARDSRGGGPLLEVLPLVLALGWSPADPQDAVELLSLPQCPIPGDVAWRLRGALGEWPAVGSPDWEAAIRDGLDALPEERRARAAERIAGIFGSSAERSSTRGHFPAAELRARAALLRTWLHGNRQRAERDAEANADSAAAATGQGEATANASLDEPTAPWDEALGFVAAFERLVDLTGVEKWSEWELHRVLDDARATLGSERVHPAQAGLAAVAQPGALVGPARRIVWWDFTRSAPRLPQRLPFSNAERSVLAKLGVELPDPGAQALDVARRFRRPLEQATGSLLLVSPLRDEAGDESFEHPLWDEIGAGAGKDAKLARIVVPELPVDFAPSRAPLAPPRVERPLAPLPTPQRHWRADPATLPVREPLSHSQLSTLLGCPVQWALQYPGRLGTTGRPDVEIGPLVFGKLAHQMLHQVAGRADGPERARDLAHQWLDEHGARYAAVIFLPGSEAERERVRRVLGDAAHLLQRFLEANDLQVEDKEKKLEGTGLGASLMGRVDLVLGPRPTVLDAKWGSGRRHRSSLEDGTATQLAFYAHLLAKQDGTGKKPHPDVGFLILSEGNLLTNQPDARPPAWHVDGPALGDTWLGLERAFDARRAELSAGRLEAPAVPDVDGESGPDGDALTDDGVIELEPGCRFCAFGGLCGVDELS